MMNYATLYLMDDNGSRSVLLSIEIGALRSWYICDCAPSGCFGDVDLYGRLFSDVRAALEKQCMDGLSPLDFARDPVGYAFRPLPDWEDGHIDDILEDINEDRTCDLTFAEEIFYDAFEGEL